VETKEVLEEEIVEVEETSKRKVGEMTEEEIEVR
jgi:hypothetical protein